MLTYELNSLNQPIGLLVPNWQPPARPARINIQGRYCRLEPLSAERHAADLFAANKLDAENRIWTYLPYGPYETLAEYTQFVNAYAGKDDPFFYAIIDNTTHKAVGIASYLRIDPTNGSIEVGHINYSPALQRTPAATEAMFLMMRQAFALGYRRYEWKCNALNAPSRTAAMRLGLSFEGVFRQAAIVKGRNRDTAWYACIDAEWPALQTAFQQWLHPDNFDAQGQQRIKLSDLTKPILKQIG
jgi:RimJ/RimL family protein N-acetyltransferase